MTLVDKTRLASATAGTVPQAASTGITITGSPLTAGYEFRGILHTTQIKVPTFSFTTTAAAKGIGQKIYTFPNGYIIPVGAVISTTLTPADNSTTGVIGLGSVVASGAVSVLSGTATFQNFLTGTALSSITGGTATPVVVGNAGGGTAGTEVAIDGHTTAVDLFLNIASTFGGTGGCVVSATTVTIHWINLGAS